MRGTHKPLTSAAPVSLSLSPKSVKTFYPHKPYTRLVLFLVLKTLS